MVFRRCLPGVGRAPGSVDFAWEALKNAAWEVSSGDGPRLSNRGFCLGGIREMMLGRCLRCGPER